MLDLTGKKYNHLTVIREMPRTFTSGGRSQRVWLCRCDCGKLIPVKQDRLTTSVNPTKSCGCIRKCKDITGERFGRLIVTGFAEPTYTKTGHLIRMVNCKCDCGNEKVIRYNDLVYGSTKSCGCFAQEINNMQAPKESHGYSQTRLYKIWKGMNRRCNSPSCRAYKWYGAKGVIVCPEWRGGKGFLNFRKWSLNNGYNEKLTIDRIDYNGNYEPQNCRWITYKEQQNNKSNNHIIEYNGVKKTLTQWAEEYGIKRHTFYSRLRYGWSIEKILNQEVDERKSSR